MYIILIYNDDCLFQKEAAIALTPLPQASIDSVIAPPSQEDSQSNHSNPSITTNDKHSSQVSSFECMFISYSDHSAVSVQQQPHSLFPLDQLIRKKLQGSLHFAVKLTSEHNEIYITLTQQETERVPCFLQFGVNSIPA